MNFFAGTLTVSQTISEVEGRIAIAETKSRSSRRTMTIPSFLLDELSAHLARRGRPGADHLIFVGPKGSPLRRSFAARVFTPAVRRSGLPDTLTFHGLRHVATTFMIEAGVHPRVIQHRLGHSTSRLSMELYAHVPEPADRAVAERLDEAFRHSGADLQPNRSLPLEP